MADLEEQKKLLLPILQRAEEIQQVEPKVAYYCRFYAVEQGLKMKSRAKEIDQLIISTLAKLEKDKPSVKLDPGSDAAYCEQFALNIFHRADRVDRAGKADEKTCKAYYAASVFMDICNQFGDLASDLVEKQRYGLWRAAEIRKAIREGRTPLPPAGDPQDNSTNPPAPPNIGEPSGLPPPPGPIDFPDFPGVPTSGPTDFPGGLPSAPSGFPSVPPPSQMGPPGPSNLPHAPPPPPPHIAGPPRFKPGDRVLYCEAGVPPFHRGTVGMVLERGGGAMYRVALPTHIVEAGEGQLALDAPPGGSVTVASSSGGGPVTAAVLAVITTEWPPRFLVKDDRGAPYEVSAEQVFPASQQQQPSGSHQQPSGSGYPQMPHVGPPLPPSDPSMPPPYHQPPPSAPSHHTAPTPSAPPSMPSYPSLHQTAPRPPAYSPPQAHSPSGPHALPDFVPGQPSLQDIAEAQKALKYATSSLSFEDIPSAVKYLTGALKLLTKQ